MALAIKFQDMIDRGEVRDFADIARLGQVTRARLTQIMNLLHLAPKLQEQLLFPEEHPPLAETTERDLRAISTSVCWEEQRKAWSTILRCPTE